MRARQALRSTGPQALALLLGLLGAASCLAWSPEKGEIPLAPDVYEYVDGTDISLAALRGRPTVLYFGGDWCIPCQETRPYVLKLAKELPGKVNVVFFSSDDNRDRPAKLAESRASDYRIAMPRYSAYPPGSRPKGLRDVGAFGRIYSFPTAIVLDASGKVVQKYERGMSIRTEIGPYVAAMAR
ncbi:TlpA family protein disulfide reductase [Variovorax terrae]|uniref:TlpA family protein disulfide reductase n=1 Tax=Variovorax terrae TaxID=2923278 RepID=A0A9X1VXK7_9BURK|nr:TlpA disulfide reductase family protein [Variovorax terrae]MCJ0763964.1 TlpA family protein disulfide reductase [Variovorax terrae]